MLDYTFDAPGENLAFDETLLDGVERGAIPNTLRFWESPAPFVVLGVSQKLAEEVDEAACQAGGVPVLRRPSAGGCVLQGPGSLNFSLAIRYDDYPESITIRRSYCWILPGIARVLKKHGVEARHSGVSDLAVGDRKVSGNAQKRRKHGMLHHGTLLHKADTAAMARYLREPADQPDYRQGRTHADFVQALPLSRETLMAVVCETFDLDLAEAADPLPGEIAEARRLAAEKYRDPAWNRRR